MILIDINLLIYAFRKDMPQHGKARAWLTRLLESREPMATSDWLLAGFVRMVTNHRVFKEPDSLEDAFAYVESICKAPSSRSITAGPGHWDLFVRLCNSSNAKGDLIPDAYNAALAIEHACDWYSTDGDYARFAGLKWINPIA